MDLGASRTRIYFKNDGLVVDEPSLAAVDTRSGGLVAVGSVAARMVGRSPDHIRVARPIASGTVVDAELAQAMLRQLVDRRVSVWRRASAMRAVVGVPHDSGPLTRKAATLALSGLGIKRVELVDIPVAAAVGCGLPVDLPEAAMVVVCGAASTQIAVLSLGAVVASTIVPVGGEAIDHAVEEHLRTLHGVVLPAGALREIYLRLGGDEVVPVVGKDVATGLARALSVESAGVRDIMGTPLYTVLDGIAGVLRRSPPDLVVDLADRGITLAGGGALVPGLDEMVRAATGMPVHLARDPQTRVIDGLARMMSGRPSSKSADADPVGRDPLKDEAVDVVAEETTDPDAFAPVA
ncbi:rod shape-determining protein [Yinghuangia seranimata]|uniref:rod shape-determining protein n=1 Tax=Yinghuangia seranimata TaxID=408067 RepID=UPI00248C5FDA|nr:rod shape-determining protein [Yinghuangia seranimata]MDI2132789.1 rod shape-determining protein [Yinghuangia seranimata]